MRPAIGVTKSSFGKRIDWGVGKPREALCGNFLVVRVEVHNIVIVADHEQHGPDRPIGRRHEVGEAKRAGKRLSDSAPQMDG